ncbi:MAG: aldose 1-epimerase [Shinella sp.]|nr:aldose 1-epimerase [Shinella sp.]
MFHRLTSDGLTVRVSRKGGSLVDGHFGGLPFLRPAAADNPADYTIDQAACFPLVPFGNRVSDNRFMVDGRECLLRPNTPHDPLYLHGDGWLADWTVTRAENGSLELDYEHTGTASSPYRYRAAQRIAVENGALSLFLGVRNTGREALPFGLGQHFFFPMTQAAIFHAAASGYWSERQGHLPGGCEDFPPDLNFREPAVMPHRWVNNAFEGWDGKARIAWPGLGLAVDIEADPVFANYMIHVPSPNPTYFCFEPMSHLPNGHNMPDFGGLKLLGTDEELGGTVTIRPHILETRK